MISLGCPSNRVDAEVMVGLIQRDESFEVVGTAEAADIVVVNTCGFIDSAKEESINTILEMIALKNRGDLARVVVTGCLAQRYASDLGVELPEVDTFLGTKTFPHIKRALHGTLEQRAYIEPGSFLTSHDSSRTSTIRGGTAYLQIAEGCSRTCSFCIIPSVRGKQVSRPIKDVVAEARRLGQQGVSEIILVAQDTTGYGLDFGSHQSNDHLTRLLRALEEQAPEISWIRLLNMYPLNITDDLINLFVQSEKLLPYVDLPLQHISAPLLTSMKRDIQREEQLKLIDRLRTIDDLVLRTSLVLGYPGETDEHFQELSDWVEEVEFDGISAFTYSKEDGTHAAALEDQVEEHIKHARRDALMGLQQDISLRKNEAWVGDRVQVIVDGVSEEHELVLEGRHYGQAPERDGVVYLSFERGGESPMPGDFVDVQIQDATAYDLAGTVIPNGTLGPQ